MCEGTEIVNSTHKIHCSAKLDDGSCIPGFEVSVFTIDKKFENFIAWYYLGIWGRIDN